MTAFATRSAMASSSRRHLHLVVTIIEAVVHRHEPIWMQARQSLGLLQRLFKFVEVTLLLRSHENAKGVDRKGVQLIHDAISNARDFSPRPQLYRPSRGNAVRWYTAFRFGRHPKTNRHALPLRDVQV
jgi:hypothetical protein